MRLIDIVNGPWAITQAMLCEIRSIYAKHLRGEKIDKAALEALAGQNNVRKADSTYELRNGTAIIQIDGVLAKKINLFMAISGGASTQLIERDIRAALSDPMVERIMLAVDSPGGTVDGTFELANLIYESRGIKPIIAWVDGSAYSAAYAIASAASEVYLSSEAAGVGSIGVVAAHEDISKWEERYGVKTTEIYAGRYKRAASQYRPLDEEGKKSIQDEVDYLFSVFVDSVARNRGVSPESVLASMSTEVQSIFIGQQAVDANMADGFATMEQIIMQNLPQREAGSASHAEASIQTVAGDVAAEITQEGETIMNLKELQEKHPDLYQSVLAEGKASGIEEGKGLGAETERARIQGVFAQAMPGHEALIQGLAFDGKTSGPEAAVAVLAAEKKKKDKVLEGLKTGAPQSVTDTTPPAIEKKPEPQAEDTTIPVEGRAKAAWDADSKIRAEFTSLTAYTAFRRAEEKGQVRIFGKHAPKE